MEQGLATMSSDELVQLYHRVNTELTKQLLNGSSLDEQQERINTLSKISNELFQRKIAVKDKRIEFINTNRNEAGKPPNE